jgi:hypothetical protein
MLNEERYKEYKLKGLLDSKQLYKNEHPTIKFESTIAKTFKKQITKPWREIFDPAAQIFLNSNVIIKKVNMFETPTNQQWEKWSKPSRATLKSYWLTIIGLLFAISTFAYTQLDNSNETKEKINLDLKEFQTAVQNVHFIREKYNPGDVYLGSVEGLQDCINKLNNHHKNMHDVVEFSRLYKLIKMYGQKTTNDKLIEFSTLVHDKTKTLVMFVSSIKPDNIIDQKQFDTINEKYINLVNEVSTAYATYHGFILGLTLDDFKY